MRIIFKKSKKEFLTHINQTEAEKWFDEDYCLKAVEQNGDALQYVK